MTLSYRRAAAQNDSIFLVPVEIKARRQTPFQNKNALFSLDSTMTSANPFVSLSELLTENSALNIRSYGTGLSTVSIRGTSSAHASVVWNGFEIQSPMNGGADLSLISAASADKIAVLSGSESAFLGNAALGGAIYLDNDGRALKDGLHGNAAVGAGSFGAWNRAAALTFADARWKLSGKYVEESAANDFEFNNVASIGSPLETEKFAAFKKTNLIFNVRYAIGEKQFLQFNEWYQRADREIEPNMIETNPSARQFDWAWRTSATYTRIQNGQSALKIKAAWIEDDLLYYSDVQDSSKNHTKTLIAGIEESRTLGVRHVIKTGATLTKNIALSNNYAGQKERNRADAFILYNGENLSGLKWKAALGEAAADGKILPFTFALGVEKPVSPNLTMSAGLSKVYHLPSLNDLYWGYLGNPALQPESGWEQELALRYAAGLETRKQEIGLTLFHISVDNWIQWTPSVGYWKPHNYKKVNSRGAECSFKTTYQTENWKLEGWAAYQLTLATSEGGGLDSTVRGKQLIYTPRHTFNARLRLDYKNVFFKFRQSYTGLRYYLTDDSQSVDPYALTDLEGGFRLSKNAYGILFTLAVNNLFDLNYQVIEYTPVFKRNYRFNLSVSF